MARSKAKRNATKIARAQPRDVAPQRTQGPLRRTVLASNPLQWARSAVTHVPLGADAETARTGAETDAIVTLVSRLFPTLGREAPDRRHVLFVSTHDASGSADIAARVAVALAWRIGGKVCLVDLDPHTPTLHERFSLAGARGFADALTDPAALEDFMHITPSASNLWVMPAGTRKAPVTATARPAHVLAELTRVFDYVIATGSPLCRYPETAQLGTSFEGAVLVLEANATRPEAARAAAEALAAAGVRLLGSVLNNRTFPIPDVLYHRL